MEDLIQEGLGCEWRRLVANVLLNRTRGSVVRVVIREFLDRWPTPDAASMADRSEVASVIAPCGLQNVKADRLVRMSRTYVEGLWTDPEDLPGIGRYGGDSWRLFDGPVEGREGVCPDDPALRRYVDRLRISCADVGE